MNIANFATCTCHMWIQLYSHTYKKNKKTKQNNIIYTQFQLKTKVLGGFLHFLKNNFNSRSLTGLTCPWQNLFWGCWGTCSQLIVFWRFSENLTCDLKVKATEIQTYSIFLVDTPTYQLKKNKNNPVSLHSLAITFANLGVHIDPLDDNTPSTFYVSGVKKWLIVRLYCIMSLFMTLDLFSVTSSTT